VSQQSYNSVLKNFTAFLSLLEKAPGYQTATLDLTLVALQDFEKLLQSANKCINAAASDLSKARIDRNLFLYTPETESVDIALSVKNYIKGIYGPPIQTIWM